jgi:hopene-associated glycosyltransferase HpnB
MNPIWLALPGLIIWAVITLLPWRPWSTRESLDGKPGIAVPDLSQITVLIPARNEADVVGRTLASVAAQGAGQRIILIDDQSADGTASAARDARVPGLEIVAGQPMPPGWTGKLWALEQGRLRTSTPLMLLLDADIELRPGVLTALHEKLQAEHLALVSLMARLSMSGFWERLLIPAFVFFFKLLYPFRLSNSRFRHVAAAAGGCILVRRDAVEEIGGFATLRGKLIDDCSLAAAIKRSGHRTWLGLTHSAVSQRPYPALRPIWDMVARTAYTQLRYSPILLAACTALMAAAFVFPLVALFVPHPAAQSLAGLSLLFMAGSYIPLLRYYELSPFRSAALPFAGVLFLLMTWTSALRHWHGNGSLWKDRSYAGTGHA